jgi:hypothetical protein
MKRKVLFIVFAAFISALLFIKIIIIIYVEPWVGKKIEIALNNKNPANKVKIGKIHISLITNVIELKNITLHLEKNQGKDEDLKVETETIRFKGIKRIKAIFKNDINIKEVIISNSRITGKIPPKQNTTPPILIPVDIRIGSLLFDKIDLSLGISSTAGYHSIKDGVLKLYNLNAKKQDTLSTRILKQFDFRAKELVSVSPDSLYSYKTNNISISSGTNKLVADSIFILPNYADYEFSSRQKFQKSRIEVRFSNISFHVLNCSGFFRQKSLICSYIEIGKMEMKVFRDKRKEFEHINKIEFQDMIYNYPGLMRIDSINLLNGNITYAEQVEKAAEQGRISFNDIHAKIYKITNDTIYKTKPAFLELKCDALLMGNSKITILLKGRIFDKNNEFSLNGTLSRVERNELNQILEKIAFVYVSSGNLDKMNFSFIANNTKATGKMTLLYHGLNIEVKNKKTDKTTAIRERLLSFFVNKKLLDSNPIPGEVVREGIIDYNRDPERYLFGYCFRSILSGIKSSLSKTTLK